jgi:hypothetical protein
VDALELAHPGTEGGAYAVPPEDLGTGENRLGTGVEQGCVVPLVDAERPAAVDPVDAGEHTAEHPAQLVGPSERRALDAERGQLRGREEPVLPGRSGEDGVT